MQSSVFQLVSDRIPKSSIDEIKRRHGSGLVSETEFREIQKGLEELEAIIGRAKTRSPFGFDENDLNRLRYLRVLP